MRPISAAHPTHGNVRSAPNRSPAGPVRKARGSGADDRVPALTRGRLHLRGSDRSRWRADRISHLTLTSGKQALLAKDLLLSQDGDATPASVWVLPRADSAHGDHAVPPPSSKRPVLATCLDVASTRALAAPPAIALPEPTTGVTDRDDERASHFHATRQQDDGRAGHTAGCCFRLISTLSQRSQPRPRVLLSCGGEHLLGRRERRT